MKTKVLSLSGVVLLAVLLMSMVSKSASTGSIKVTTLTGGKPAGNALVGVSTSAENLENSKYVYEGFTNTAGQIIFKSVAPGTYFVDADLDGLIAEGKVTVASGEAAITLNLKEDSGDDD